MSHFGIWKYLLNRYFIFNESINLSNKNLLDKRGSPDEINEFPILHSYAQ